MRRRFRFIYSLAVLRSTASAAVTARSGPFCSAFGEEDGRDYAEAIQLQINPRVNFGGAFFPNVSQYWIQQSSQNLGLSTERRYVRLAVGPKDVFLFPFFSLEPASFRKRSTREGVISFTAIL